MLRSFFRVARPDDWLGTLAGVATGIGTVMILLVVLMVRLPVAWTAAADGAGWIVRAILVVVWLALAGGIRSVIFARLPGAAYLLGRRLSLRVRGKTVKLELSDVTEVRVERRDPPVREAFVVELRDGSAYDVCPVHWDGAGPLYRALKRRMS